MIEIIIMKGKTEMIIKKILAFISLILFVFIGSQTASAATVVRGPENNVNITILRNHSGYVHPDVHLHNLNSLHTRLGLIEDQAGFYYFCLDESLYYPENSGYLPNYEPETNMSVAWLMNNFYANQGVKNNVTNVPSYKEANELTRYSATQIAIWGITNPPINKSIYDENPIIQQLYTEAKKHSDGSNSVQDTIDKMDNIKINPQEVIQDGEKDGFYNYRIKYTSTLDAETEKLFKIDSEKDVKITVLSVKNNKKTVIPDADYKVSTENKTLYLSIPKKYIVDENPDEIHVNASIPVITTGLYALAYNPKDKTNQPIGHSVYLTNQIDTNAKIEPDKNITQVSVSKKWSDDNNQDGKRPESAKVQLYGNNKAVGSIVNLSEKNQWSHTWNDLDEKENGKDIVYTVKEVDVAEGYVPSVDNDNIGNIIITNSHTPETTSLAGAKTWDDNNDQDRKRPKKITVNLLADGKQVDTKVVTSENNWSYNFKNLPKYQNGREIKYTVTEDTVAGYTTEVNGSNITNSYNPGKTSVSVSKAWNDQNNQDGKRPESAKVQLYGNNKAVGSIVNLSEKNQWSHTWNDLDEKENGKDIVYTVKEVDVAEGYVPSVDNDNIGNIIITNSHTPETTSLAGAKTWDDNNDQDRKRPKKITVNLLADGKQVDTKVVTSENNWSYNFKNLPKYQNGREIKYTVTEDAVAGYTTKVNGSNITNFYTPKTGENISYTPKTGENISYTPKTGENTSYTPKTGKNIFNLPSTGDKITKIVEYFGIFLLVISTCFYGFTIFKNKG